MRHLALPGIWLLLSACAGAGPDFAQGERPADPEGEPVARPWIACPEGGCVADVHVLQATDLPPPCPDPDCVAEYLAFAEAAADFGVPVDPAGLEEQVLALHHNDQGVPAPPDLEAEALREALIWATDTGFLFEGLDERELLLEVVQTVPADWGWEEHLVVRDPWIGSLEMVLLRPLGDGPFPGLVASPGHGEDWWDMRDAHFGDQLVLGSWAILIVDPRASGADDAETLVTRTLLEAGLSFAGVRVYEQLLARKVLRWRDDVHPDLVAVWGHSGGSVIANLSVRIGDFAALVSDLQGEYLNIIPDGPWLDETSPALHAWHAAINDRSTLDVPAWDDDYGYPQGPDPIRAFLYGDVLGF